MIIFKTAAHLTRFIKKTKEYGKTVGFVPTMGALHKGHISLVQTGKEQSGIVVCSIFVNPTQFNNASDFEKYPLTIESDLDQLEKAGCDVVFLPAGSEIYPPGYVAPVYELGYLEEILEGEFRPGHYQGVCQVVERLLQIVQPDKLYLGQKDFQQCMVIRKMTEIKNIKTEIHIGNTVREPDGLAMSSRNVRLSAEARKKAPAMHESLVLAREGMKPGPLEEIKTKALHHLKNAGFKPDYVEVADASNLVVLKHWDGKMPVVVLTAAYLDEVRLIDNLLK